MRSRLGNNGGNMTVYGSENLNDLHPNLLTYVTLEMYYIASSDVRKNEGGSLKG